MKFGIILRPDEFERGFQVGLPLFEVSEPGEVPLNRGFASSYLGGDVRIFPEIGLGAFLLEFLEFVS